jgi:hypothetical protein
MMNMFKRVTVQGDVITARAYHQSIVFNDLLFVLMGYSGVVRLGDMYWTNNGQRWHRQENLVCDDGNVISARQSPGLCAHAGKVYLTGGYSGSYLNDVYVSDNMFRWKRLQDAPWDARREHVMVSFRGKLWLLGGMIATGYKNDVWSTVDGVNWVQELDAPWTARRGFAGMVYNNRIIIAGGFDSISGRLSDVWSTVDGRNWQETRRSAEFNVVYYHAMTSFRNKVGARLVVCGGSQGVGDTSEKIWHSSDGKNWNDGGVMGTNTVYGHTIDYFNKRLIIVCGNGGGGDAGAFINRVWESNIEMLGIK